MFKAAFKEYALLYMYWNMVNFVPIFFLLSLDYKIHPQIYHFVRILLCSVTLNFELDENSIKFTISIAEVQHILASGSKIMSNLPLIKMDFILAFVKPFPFQFYHLSCFFQVNSNELR